MHQYRVRYSILRGGGTREEIVSGRSEYEAQRTIESRFAPGQVVIVTVIKIN